MKLTMTKQGDLYITEMLSEIEVPQKMLPALVRLVVEKWTAEARAQLAAELAPAAPAKPAIEVVEPPKVEPAK